MIPARVPAYESERLETLRRYQILDTGPERTFDTITKFISKQFNTDIALISMIDRDRQWFKATCGLDVSETPRDLAFCAYTILDQQITCIPDASADERFKDNPLVTSPPHIRFYCGAPLIAPNGHIVGSVAIVDREPRSGFSASDKALLQDIAAMIVDHMEMRISTRAFEAEIATREEAEAKAKAASNDLHALIENVPLAMALVGRDGYYRVRSDLWTDLQSGVFQQGNQENFILSIRGRDDWLEAFYDVLAGKEAGRIEDILRLKDGSIEYFKWEMKPWHGDDGQIEGAVISAALITEQVTARLEAERQNELINAVLENVKDGIIACDQNGRLTLFNKQAKAIHGLDVEDLPREECASFYSLFEADGATPLATERIPLFRALSGERVIDQNLVIAPNDLPRRAVVAQGTPLKCQDGTLIGAVASMTDVTEAKEALEKLKDSEAKAVHIAYHDTLTGLGNRAKFNAFKEKRELLASEKPTAAFFIDLNRFKLVNDTLGHKYGDDLLRRVANILQGSFGTDAFVARIGGDEFIALLPVEGTGHALTIAEILYESLSAPIAMGGQSVITGAAIGVAIAPDHGDDVETLVRRADIAMYRGKTDHAGAPVLFEPVFELNTIERTRLERELVKSIDNNELRVVYQPIVCSANDTIMGVEALVRWEHPRLGLVRPDEFISIAEECGFIIDLGAWVLETALQQLSPWKDLFLSVNVSPVQVRDPGFVQMVRSALERTGFNPKRLELEITENTLINDADGARKVINELTASGVGIALDDFGTGYSSLSYIHDFPFSKVKIDRSFVSRIGNGTSSAHSIAIVKCVVDLAWALGMLVTAEGVETDDHERILKEIGCHTLQGYKYGKPTALSEICASYCVTQSVA
ncbi:MAG: EAL domain-containing protein [Pseudomonadota bacterium]